MTQTADRIHALTADFSLEDQEEVEALMLSQAEMIAGDMAAEVQRRNELTLRSLAEYERGEFHPINKLRSELDTFKAELRDMQRR